MARINHICRRGKQGAEKRHCQTSRKGEIYGLLFFPVKNENQLPGLDETGFTSGVLKKLGIGFEAVLPILVLGNLTLCFINFGKLLVTLTLQTAFLRPLGRDGEHTDPDQEHQKRPKRDSRYYGTCLFHLRTTTVLLE